MGEQVVESMNVFIVPATKGIKYSLPIDPVRIEFSQDEFEDISELDADEEEALNERMDKEIGHLLTDDDQANDDIINEWLNRDGNCNAKVEQIRSTWLELWLTERDIDTLIEFLPKLRQNLREQYDVDAKIESGA